MGTVLQFQTRVQLQHRAKNESAPADSGINLPSPCQTYFTATALLGVAAMLFYAGTVCWLTGINTKANGPKG